MVDDIPADRHHDRPELGEAMIDKAIQGFKDGLEKYMDDIAEARTMADAIDEGNRAVLRDVMRHVLLQATLPLANYKKRIDEHPHELTARDIQKALLSANFKHRG